MDNDIRIELANADSTGGQVAAPFPADAPNVLIVVLDDLGFAQLGCYGSDIDTPNLDRVAAAGLRFGNFHTTAVCSPTRACLLTGRNHHRVGIGMLTDLPRNFDGYRGVFPEGAGTLAEVLGAAGWSTTAIGKWHLTPRDHRSTGPFDMWPLGVGFDRYYGFLNGETNQWTPNLIRDNSHVEPPSTPDEGYHLEADLADEAIAALRDLRHTHGERPWMMWYATGAPHAPHQAPPDWIDRYRGRFDQGWDAWRDETLARQKELGVVPADVELSERPEWVRPWDALSADEQRLFARMMEVYAGFVSHADHHLGRVLDAIEAAGELDDTIVVVISDNGCSAEGGPNGAFNQIGHYISDEEDDLALDLSHFDDLGGFRSSGHYPWGWALAGNTPLRRWKRYTFEGGIRDPLIVSWPAGLSDAGGIRDQYCHVTDLMPTILDCAGVTPPAKLGGVTQMSLDGTSLRALFDAPDAPTQHPRQYYECWGSRAIYSDGWKAVTNHVNQLTLHERRSIVGSSDFGLDEWELFHIDEDFTESVNLAASHPDKLAELVAIWHEEAERNQVLPLHDGSSVGQFENMLMPWMDFRSHFRFEPGDKIHEIAGPILSGGFRMVASFAEPVGAAASGVIAEQGDWISGWAWYLGDGAATWTLADRYGPHRVRAELPPDTRLLVVEATREGDERYRLEFSSESGPIGGGTIERPIHPTWAPDGAFLTVAHGRPFPVCDDYEPPASLSVGLAALTIDIGAPPPLDVEAELERAMRHQ